MLAKLEAAIKRVDKKYITDEHQNYEKMFQFELYHQIREIDIKNIDITAELKKESTFFKENPFNENNVKSCIPDLLFHNLVNQERQSIAIEIKSIKKNDMGKIYEDIRKLMKYCHKNREALNYEYGILILFNGNFKDKYKRAIKYKSKIDILFSYAYNPVEIWVYNGDNVEKYTKDDFQRGIT